MAEFRNITPPDHSYVSSQEVYQNATYYNYYGIITLKAYNGYYFDANETYVMYKPNDTQSRITGVIQADNTVCRFTIPSNNYSYGNLNNAIVFDGVLASSVVPRELTVDTVLNNCTISGLPQTVTDKSTLNLTLTAAANCTFEQTPLMDFGSVVLNPDGNPVRSVNFTVSLDGLSASLSIDLSEYDLDYMSTVNTITINATAQSAVHSVPITRTLSNCTTNAPSNISETDTTVNIICTASNGFQFDTAPQIVFYDAYNVALHTFTFTVLSSKLSANVTFDVSQMADFSDVASIILTATATAETITIPVTTTVQNAVLTGLPQIVYTDTVLQLTATANNGYEFNSEMPPQVITIDANGNPQVVNFTLSVNNTVANATVNLSNYTLDEYSNITITANATAITPYVDKYGTINVYKVTPQNLSDFAAVRFKVEKDDDSGYFQLVDLGDYVVSVKRFYCTVSDVLTAYIKAGNYNTNIQVETPQNDNFNIDCGTVTIPLINNTAVDYENTEIQVFIPFVGFVSISSDYVGKTIALQYRVNIVDGDCVAVLSCNGVNIDFIECTISNDIIFKTNKENNFGGNAEFNLQVLKGLQPYIVIKYVLDETKKIYNSDSIRCTLGTIEGYAEISELTNFDCANVSQNVFDLIVDTLRNGVYF